MGMDEMTPNQLTRVFRRIIAIIDRQKLPTEIAEQMLAEVMDLFGEEVTRGVRVEPEL